MITGLKKQGRVWALLVAFAMLFTILPVVPASAADLKVTFDTGGGKPAPTVQNVAYDKTASRPVMDPTAPNSKFMNWYDSKVGGIVWNFPNRPIKVDTTIYAQWQTVGVTTYEVKLVLNDGVLDESVAEVMYVPYNTVAQKPNPDPTRSGYRFDGWFKDATFNNAYDFSTPVIDNISLYAKWNKKSSSGGGGGGGGSVQEPDKDKDEPKPEDKDKNEPGDESKPEDKVTLTDIAGHWAEKYVREAVEKGFVKGFPDGTFRPDSNVTRAEFTCLIVNALAIPNNPNGHVFGDIVNHWSKEMVVTAAAAGIVSGFDDTRFGPDQFITREQMTAIAARAVKLQAGMNAKVFTDQAVIAPWAVGSVNAATSNNVIVGYPDGSFRPQNTATRAEAVVVVLNLLKVK